MSENFNLNDFAPEQENDAAENGISLNDAADNANTAEATEEENKKEKKRKKMPAWLKILIWILAIVICAVGISTVIIVGTAEYLGIGPGRTGKVSIYIESGMSTSEIAAELKENGAINSEIAFRVYSRLKGYDGKYQIGLHSFNKEIGYNDLAAELMTQRATAKTVRLTIPEGIGINDYVKNVNGENVTVPGIASRFEEAGICTKSEFLIALEEVEKDFNIKLMTYADSARTYYTLEGYLFPDTYEFYVCNPDDPESVANAKQYAVLAIEKMIQQADSKITEEMYNRADELGVSINEIMTMASIIQMESGSDTDHMSDVAAVFYNRLNNSAEFPTLGSSPTCYYGNSFKKDDGRYNTYEAKGLPPGPLCSPGIDAIKAALYPTEDSPYYYFVTDSTGKFYFHKTLSEQNATISKLQQGNNWTYEYFE